MQRVFILCDQLHAVADPRKNAFRPQVTVKDKDVFKTGKKDLLDNQYVNDRIKQINNR
jgi:hypothetical protein